MPRFDRKLCLAVALLLIPPVAANSRVHANAVFLHADSEKEEYRDCLTSVQKQFEACDKDDQQCQCDVMKIIGDECSKYCSDPVNSQYLELFGQQQCDWIEQDVYKDPSPEEMVPEEVIDEYDCYMEQDGDSVDLKDNGHDNDHDKRYDHDDGGRSGNTDDVTDGDHSDDGSDDTTNDTTGNDTTGDAYDDTSYDSDDTYDGETTQDDSYHDESYAADFVHDGVASAAYTYDPAQAYADKWANYLEIFRIAPQNGLLDLGDTDPMNPGSHPLSALVEDDDDEGLHDVFDHTPYYHHDNELTFSPEDEAKLVRLAKDMLEDAGDDADTVAIWAEAKQRVLAERKKFLDSPEEPSGDTPEVLNGSNLYPVPGTDFVVDGEDGSDGGALPGPHSGGDPTWVDGPPLESTIRDPLDVTSGYDKDDVLDVPAEGVNDSEGGFQVEVEPVTPDDVVLDPDTTPPIQIIPDVEPDAAGVDYSDMYHSDNELPVVPDDHIYQPPHSYEPKIVIEDDGEPEPVHGEEPDHEEEPYHEPIPEPVDEWHPEEPIPEEHIPEEHYPEPVEEWHPEEHVPEDGHWPEEHYPEESFHEEPHHGEHYEEYHEGEESQELLGVDEELHHGDHDDHEDYNDYEDDHENHEEHSENHHDGEPYVKINDGIEEHHNEPHEHNHEHNLEYHEEYHNTEPHHEPPQPEHQPEPEYHHESEPEYHHDPEYHEPEYHHEPEHQDHFEASDFHEFPPAGDEYFDGDPAPLTEGVFEDDDGPADSFEGASLAEKLKQLYPNGEAPRMVNQDPDNPAYDFDGYDTDHHADVYPGGETPYGNYFGDAFGFSSEAPRLKPLITTLTLGLVVVALFNRDLAPTICFFLSSLSVGLYIYNYELNF
ncbi:hypothetical protein CJU90_4435 [Yarrowia sp. C11]|nr:hypothetical protein CKK34_6717 [Yarrowia sp. E02]KAG5365358.1 hypothetical protein CJU90_4435 [Yarrowia sp. C11]